LSKNLVLRILVAAIFGPLIILISYLGGYWLFGMILLFASIGIIEFMIGNKIGSANFQFWITLLAVMAMIIASTQMSMAWSTSVFVGYFLLIGIIHAVRKESPDRLFESQIRLVWSVAYLGFLYPYVYFIRLALPESGGDWLFFLFGTLWLSDTLAMFGGKAFGKRKLAPTVSPNKTIAGFVCGLVGGIIVAIIMFFWRLSNIDILILCGAGLSISLIGQLGDLVESMWKRAINIKDSSAIIPGHGGVLDRFDSLLSLEIAKRFQGFNPRNTLCFAGRMQNESVGGN